MIDKGDGGKAGMDEAMKQIAAEKAERDRVNNLKAFRAWIGTKFEDQIPEDYRAELGLPPRE